MTTGRATKYDSGKPTYHLLDRDMRSSGRVRELLYAGRYREAYDEASAILCPTNPRAAMAREVSFVLAHGADKYGKNNWKGGMEWSRLVDAGDRHWSAFERGEILDPESGRPHLAHFGCCMMFLHVYQRDGLGTKDL